MYRSSGSLVLSPSDLVAHLECRHLSALERAVADGELQRPEHHDPELDVLRRRGDEHEWAELERLRAEGLSVVEIAKPGHTLVELAAAEALTLEAMRSGADVVFQASFFDGRWRGSADFLLRVDSPTELGPWGYEVADTKLARRAKPAALLQLCAYAEQVARLQGAWPEHVEVVTGTRERLRHRVGDLVAWYRAAKARFEASLLTDDVVTTYPEPVPHCRICPWADRCGRRWRADDHLSIVAGYRRDMGPKLAAVGVTTVAELAADPVGGEVPRMGQPTADRLRRQARLQVEGRRREGVRAELLDPVGGCGLLALPEPHPADVFFDLEGDPWAADGGLEYLFGMVERDAEGGGRWAYREWWAHEPATERVAFEAVVDHLTARHRAHPGMHVYHYAPYEITALRRLMGRYATREAEVDALLRAEVFVDLYRVVRQGVRVSTESYGLKALEPLYLPPRDGAVSDGGSSVVVYEEWLETGDAGLLEDLRAYNEVDCRSTRGLRDWLEARRAELEARLGAGVARPERPGGEVSTTQMEAEIETAALTARLLEGVPLDAEARTPQQRGLALLAALLDWHRREKKPEWWAWFDRLERTDAELVEDHESLGELGYLGVVETVDRSLVHRYAYEPGQEHKVAVRSRLVDPRTRRSAGDVVAVDPVAGTIDLRRSTSGGAPHPRSLVPDRPLQDTDQRRALHALGTWVADHGIDHPGPGHRAVRHLLLGRPPAVVGAPAGGRLTGAEEPPDEAALRLAPALDGAVLAVQGPPGSGKTCTGARLVVDLVRRGKRVGLTAMSHSAIANLLSAVCEQAAREGVELRALQKADEHQACTAAAIEWTTSNQRVDHAIVSGDVDVVAGTSWLFARPALAGALDVLVVDEAGQLSLANVAAVAQAARDVILLGDPQQLSQPSKGVHPPGAGLSALEHVLAGADTIAPDRGLFLDRTHRLHPEVCRFVSELAYDGRLEASPATKVHEVGPGPLVEGAGLRFVPVDHVCNRTRSPEEAAVVRALVDALLGREVTDRDGQLGFLTLEDIVVIAPYNAQVAELALALPDGARIGTVDRFQGQEAPVVVYSMGSSSADDAPRGLGFLFSRNRLNVAVSRARALVVVVASPALLAARCRTAEQVPLVNGLCRFVELAAQVSALSFSAPRHGAPGQGAPG